ncbi:MAG: SAM-dependent DNA methyltransferase [Verrucomicrobiales bacterium]|nr:SAM-dependent DNA methyltransferase [Verrucomicrobiales bacterium]
MLSPQLRKKVDNLWSLFWSAGMTNPLVAIEQITYLLFLRQLERLDAERVKNRKPSIYGRTSHDRHEARHVEEFEECRWSYIRQNPSFRLLNDTVFPWLRGLEKRLASLPANGDDKLRQVTGRLDDAYFVLDPNKTDTLTRAVQAIDELFRQLDTRGANADIMGDIFEHLLSEIQSSGKNGQFRTPRHIIRFMVELLDPTPGAKILDPASGTGGFLVNTLLHWRARTTDPETLRLEWDGTPHRAFGDVSFEKLPLDTCVTGYDNDRTMVRIGWMNLILHGLEFPRIEQRDSLSKRMPDDESGTYDYVLANPPFTGSVDEGDLSPNRQRFPAGKGNKPITTKSELLFVWLLLDLLKVGGRAAVVVPDGVLFGSTNAHKELRRQLLFENSLEAVVSLPAGVFQPYAGVKTSILLFQKAELPDSKLKPGDEPRTREVWFYEVEDEAYTLDQKRKERPGQDNDLWDALEKFKQWRSRIQGKPPKPDDTAGTRYWQPDYWQERWRTVDKDFVRIFPEHSIQQDQVLGIHEAFSELPRDPKASEESVAGQVKFLFTRWLIHTFAQRIGNRFLREPRKTLTDSERDSIRVALRKAAQEVRNGCREPIRELLENDHEQHAKELLLKTLGEEEGRLAESLEAALAEGALQKIVTDSTAGKRQKAPAAENWHQLIKNAVTSLARLDGYDVWLRSILAKPREAKSDQKRQLSWVVPVREWARLDSWGQDAKTGREIKKSTHDKSGLLRTDYLDWLRKKLKVFASDGTVKPEFRERLDPACIEATELNLSARRHKPFVFEAGEHRPAAEIIRELDGVHAEIRKRLGKLLAMVEGEG